MNQELVDYIKQQTNLSVSKNKITDILLGQGWQQSELDEAFAAAEGVPLSVKFSGNDPAARRLGDYEDGASDAGSGMNRSMIIAVASVLVVLGIIAGAVILVGGNKKNNSNNGANVANNQENRQTDSASTTEVAAKKAADEAAAMEAAGKAALADEAARLAGLIIPPDGWALRRAAVRERPMAVFFKPAVEKDKSGKDIFNERMSVTFEDIKVMGAANQDEYIANTKKLLQQTISDYKITAERKVNLADGSPATLIGATFTQDGVALRNMQLFAVAGSEAYLATGVVLASNWEQEKDMLGTAVMSFKFPAKN